MTEEHVLGILPTGTGKSLCYQIPTLSRYDGVRVPSPGAFAQGTGTNPKRCSSRISPVIPREVTLRLRIANHAGA